MKKKMITTAIITAALFVTVMTGCGSEESEESINITMPSESVEETAAEETTTAQDGDIGLEEAKSIALSMVPGATEADIKEMKREYDDGRLEYEGSIYYDGCEYEFEIDAATGSILKMEIESR